ncbi:MAG: hypothetical protein ACR2FS_19565 [Phormidesmis sp.]
MTQPLVPLPLLEPAPSPPSVRAPCPYPLLSAKSGEVTQPY